MKKETYNILNNRKENVKIFNGIIEDYKKENRFFFVDKKELSIYTNDANENFLSFYLHILINVICSNNFNRLSSLIFNELNPSEITSFYFYVPKSLKEYSKKDLEIMLDELGMNSDLEYTDKIGIIY